MKKLFLIAFVFAAFNGFSQIKTPSASPFSKIEQDFGLSTVTIEYSRPSVKNRVIFADDGLVPYGKLWRTGANSATKMTFESDVFLNGKELKAGSYAVLSTPTMTSFKFHFHAYDKSGWSSYKDKTPTLSVSASPKAMANTVETFTFATSNLTDSSMDIDMIWAKTKVTLKVKTEVDKAVMASIDKVMAGPSKGDYYNAASYYYSAGKNLSQALNWIEKATAGDDPKYWQIRKKSQILAGLGKFQEAVKVAQHSKELAMAADNADYVKMNEDSIAEWETNYKKKKTK